MPKTITTAQDIATLGTILGVWAHPDDESFVAAGILATAARNGQTVVCATATEGEAGIQDITKWPAETLGATRVAELRAALAVLGVEQHVWLGYPDGGCAEISQAKAVAGIRSLLRRFQPDTVITFGPDGLTGHPDHCAVSRWATLAAGSVRPRPRLFYAVHTPEQHEHFKPADARLNIFFNIDQPPLRAAENCVIAYELPRDIMALKHQAFKVMPSQTQKLLRVLTPRAFYRAFGAEYFVEYNPQEDEPMTDSDTMKHQPESYWKGKLTPEQYHIMREKGTEVPWTGIYVDNHASGMYRCAACGQELFSSETKFDSGSGWPSFYDVAATGRVELHEDSSAGLQRTEVTCANCGAHLGHVFPDGPADKTGQRYCINSAALDFKAAK